MTLPNKRGKHVGNGAPANAATQQNAKTPTCVSDPSQTQQQLRMKLMKDAKTAKRKASSSSSAVDKSKKKGKNTHTKSKSVTKQSANTAPLTKPQPKMSSCTASNHLDAVSRIVAVGHPLNKPCDHIASKVHNKKIKFKDGEVYCCQNAENVNYDCTRAYCKGCFAKFIQGPEDKAVSSKNRRARGASIASHHRTNNPTKCMLPKIVITMEVCLSQLTAQGVMESLYDKFVV